jgi:hypothetical protein
MVVVRDDIPLADRVSSFSFLLPLPSSPSLSPPSSLPLTLPGDILNFGMAQELCQKEGIEVSMVVVRDDIALADRVDPRRSRGIAGTVFVHKVAGALAKNGESVICI